MATNATNFREYPRGAQPGDWRALYGGTEPWRVRSVDGDPERSSWLAAPAIATAELLAWTVAEGEPGIADPEVLALVMVPGATACRVLALRGAGTASSPTYIGVTLDPSGPSFSVADVVAGSATVRASGPLSGLRGFAPWWVRLRASGTALSVKAWAYGSPEPGSWTATGTTGISAAGSIGIPRQADGFGCETLFFSYGTGGDTAPGSSAIPPGLASWSIDPDAQVEITVELAGADPSTGLPLPSVFVSTHGRFTRASDFPASEEMAAVVVDPGSVALRLAEDLLYGPADGSLGKVTLRNDRNQLSYLMDRTLAGYRLTARAGLAGWASHRWFEPIYSSLIDGEPTVQDVVEIALQAPYAQLLPNLSASRYSGVPTALQLSGAGHAAPYLAAYDLTRFLVTCRIGATASGADVGVRKATSATAENFFLGVEAGSGHYLARASIGGVAGALTLRSAAFADGTYHQLGFGVDATAGAYLLLDGQPVAHAMPSGLVDTPATAIALVGFAGQAIFDIRLLNFCPSIEEAQVMFATRAAGDDPGMTGLWPCDDGAGATATDYAAAGNSIALAGTAGVNYTWIPTDSGEKDQAGTQVQIAAGMIYNAPALLIDHNRQRVRLSDGALPGVITLRSKGQVVAGSDVGGGVYQFASLQSEPITWDQGPAAGGSEDHLRLATVTEGVLAGRMGLGEDAYDPIATRALSAILPFNVEFFAPAEVAGRTALDGLLGPVGAHYRLDHDGRIVPGMLLPPVSPGPIADDAAIELLGTAGRSRIAWGSTSADLPAGDFTIASWVKSFAVDRWTLDGDGADPFPSYGAIANNLSAANGGYYIGFYRASQGSIGFKIPFLTGTYFVTPPGVVQWGMWTLVACRFNSATSTLSIWAGRPGEPMVKVYERPSTTGTPFAAAQGLELGGRLAAGAQGSLAGSIAHYQVRNVALSDAAIQALLVANGVPTLPDSSVLFYAPINDGQGAFAVDLISGTYGRIWGARWAPRLVLDFRAGLSASTFKAKTLRPAWNVLVHYGRNLHPLADADFAAPVTPEERGKLKREWQVQPAAARDIKATYRNAREIGGSGPDGTGELDSAVMERDAAVRTARTLRMRFAPGMVQGAVGSAPRATLSLGMTDEVRIYHPALPGSQGAACRVAGLAPTFRNLRSGVDLWGMRLPAVTILDDDSGTLMGDDGSSIEGD